jgi:hypothetical protein
MDATRGRLCLLPALRGQQQIGAPAEVLGRDAFDMAVPDKNDLGHPLVLWRVVR